VILIDDSKSPCETAMICLAEYAEPDAINMMIKYAKGMVSVGMTPEMEKRVGLPRQTLNESPGSPFVRNYTVSIDADETTTGISAPERSLSIKKLASTRTHDGFRQPGHIFPVVGEEGGLYKKIALIEGSLDFARLSNKPGMTVICEILDSTGHMANEGYARELAEGL
jgi:3,4-dihydroxy 2-butanone 4-phosphate synthase/GTP cyclohydrolase II